MKEASERCRSDYILMDRVMRGVSAEVNSLQFHWDFVSPPREAHP